MKKLRVVRGCSEGTVASRLNRAHKALGRRLSHLAEGKPGMSEWLELELADQLAPVLAPERLWQSVQAERPRPEVRRRPLRAVLLVARHS
jgi:hypothetical protein